MGQKIQVTLLQKNSPAPYSGVLLPVEDLRILEKDHLDMMLYKNELQTQLDEAPLITPSDHSLIVITGIASLIIGLVIGHVTR